MAKTAANISDLASRLKLSKGTVSRILNDDTAPFAPETRRRVKALAAEIGYRPNPVARALATGRTGIVALSLPHIRTAYYARLAQLVEEQVEGHAHRMVINLHGWGPRKLMPTSADGIIAEGVDAASWQQWNEVFARNTVVVSTGVFCNREARDYVGIDLSQAARDGMAHLIQPGRKRIAYLGHHLTYANSALDLRYKTYVTAMTAAGLPLEFIDVGSEARAVVRQSVRDYITTRGCPEALFCHNDDMAIAASRALCDLGLRIPNDVALLGCDGIEDTEYLDVPISTIVQPLDEMCRLAWQYLKRRMQEPDAPPQQTVLQSALALRESSSH